MQITYNTPKTLLLKLYLVLNQLAQLKNNDLKTFKTADVSAYNFYIIILIQDFQFLYQSSVIINFPKINISLQKSFAYYSFLA